ncbi:hypothetical protein E2562_004020 [Oryza meyeriana var. granulata]|uniref:Uncharacterized protein n=1 Tax=Oryza meyeriana var. granulata TaxID=110450 RepID=A0A6G1BJB8_9ORYZ|nr:hypothetical protein E2562_004020 [Oryza meyeriana var. granulata]
MHEQREKQSGNQGASERATMSRLMHAAAVGVRRRPCIGGIRSAAPWWIHSSGGGPTGGDSAGCRGADAEGEAETAAWPQIGARGAWGGPRRQRSMAGGLS